ncbi:MAG TPA: tetratricopeptide repeat protein [Candidatus Eisenbacteria bacterium]|nr:tetratricopeptide repeat protein [Candidatus Eisenbacteria bacterium]
MSSTAHRLERRTLLGLAAILLFFVARYLWVVHVAWINDDFLFLERARISSFIGNASAEDAIGNAYRPISRNFYFWTARRLFGTEPLGFHVASLLIAMASLVLFFFVLRRLFAPPRSDLSSADGPALVGTLLFAAHPVAATPVAWACGVQDLLCVGLASAAFLAFLSGKRVLYPALTMAAVLSKEAAVALPLVVWTYDVLVRRTGWKRATVAQAPMLVLLAVWAATNPWLPWAERGALVHSPVRGRTSLFGRHDPAAAWLALRSLVLAVPGIDFVWPFGWQATAGQILFAAAALVIALRASWPKRPVRWLALVGLVWVVTGVLPLFAVISHFVYYGFYPALGAAIVAVAALVLLFRSSRTVWIGRVAAVAMVGALIAGAGQRHTPNLLDGQAVRRSSSYLTRFESDLRRMHPTLEPGAHCYFWNVPVNIGFQLADGIALRVWYADSTLRGEWMDDYVPAPGHRDYFFGHDGNGHLFEIVRGEPDPYMKNPPATFADCHNDLGVRLANLGDVAGAQTEWRKVLRVAPRHAPTLYNLGLAQLDAGHSVEGTALLERSVEADSMRADAWYFLAYSQLQQARYDDAAESAARFLDLGSDPRRAEEMRAIISRAQERGGPTGS